MNYSVKRYRTYSWMPKYRTGLAVLRGGCPDRKKRDEARFWRDAWVNRWFSTTFLDHYCLIFVFKHIIKFEYNIAQTARICYAREFYSNEMAIPFFSIGSVLPIFLVFGIMFNIILLVLVESLMEQEILTLPEHLSSQPVFSGVRVTRSLVYISRPID
jgi:hypothetical protein